MCEDVPFLKADVRRRILDRPGDDRELALGVGVASSGAGECDVGHGVAFLSERECPTHARLSPLPAILVAVSSSGVVGRAV